MSTTVAHCAGRRLSVRGNPSAFGFDIFEDRQPWEQSERLENNSSSLSSSLTKPLVGLINENRFDSLRVLDNDRRTNTDKCRPTMTSESIAPRMVRWSSFGMRLQEMMQYM
jgi:hypothetical protein